MNTPATETAVTETLATETRAAATEDQKPRRRRPSRDQESHLRDLVGAGPSQLGVSGALRARDVDRPTPADLAEAERGAVIVRRHWQPEPGGSTPSKGSPH